MRGVPLLYEVRSCRNGEGGEKKDKKKYYSQLKQALCRSHWTRNPSVAPLVHRNTASHVINNLICIDLDLHTCHLPSSAEKKSTFISNVIHPSSRLPRISAFFFPFFCFPLKGWHNAASHWLVYCSDSDEKCKHYIGYMASITTPLTLSLPLFLPFSHPLAPLYLFSPLL